MNLNGKVIVFQGDSITDMARGRTTWDQNHLYGHSYVFLIASKLGYENPQGKTVFYNRGNSGDRCVDVQARWQEDAIDLKPDIVSLLVGINDILAGLDSERGVTAEMYEQTLCDIVETTKQALPQVTFVLCEPICFTESARDEYKQPFAQLVPLHQQAVRRVAEKYGCIFVPLQEDFDKAYADNPDLGQGYWLWDGIHPTAAGQQLIARKWLRVVADGEKMTEAKDETLFDGFVSNTVVGTGHNMALLLPKGEARTHISFIKPLYYGEHIWKLWYANTVDSTFDQGEVAYAGRCGGHFTVKDAFLAVADTPEMACVREKTPVTYNGATMKRVTPNEAFCSDEVSFAVPEGAYVVFGWTVVAEDEQTVVPFSPDSQIPCLEAINGGAFVPTVNACKPNWWAVKKNDVKQWGFLGDSITQGCGTSIDAYEFWAGRIGYALKERYSTWNLGLGFARAKDAAQKGTWFYKACRCDVLCICLGINEVLNNPEESGQDILCSLNEVIEGVKQHNPAVKLILFTLPPPNDPHTRIEVWRQVNRGIRCELSRKVDAVFDIAAVLGNAQGVDYLSRVGDLHPNGEGGKIVATAFLEQLEHGEKNLYD